MTEQTPEPQRPTSNDDRAGWRAYWTAQGMPWRTEPEIDEERQQHLAGRRAVKPDIAQGIYPFKDIELGRADIEWLLATHESGGERGPLYSTDGIQATRTGLDVRGADLSGANLDNLPLAHLRAGLGRDEWRNAELEQGAHAAATMCRASLQYSHLEGSYLAGVDFTGAHLLSTHLEGAYLNSAQLQGGYLIGAYFSSATNLYRPRMTDKVHGPVSLADIRWGGVNLGGITWEQLDILGDEYNLRKGARAPVDELLFPFPLDKLESAVRANRQLALLLRNQGIDEQADRFAFRAQLLQRQVLRRQGRWRRAFGSWLLDLISGYGYKPLRSLFAYVLIILLFAAAYLLNAQFAAPHLTWDESLVLSISSFHGRGFFTTGISLGDMLARLAAGEAIIGLLIEITFIATFTQRFFAR